MYPICIIDYAFAIKKVLLQAQVGAEGVSARAGPAARSLGGEGQNVVFTMIALVYIQHPEDPESFVLVHEKGDRGWWLCLEVLRD